MYLKVGLRYIILMVSTVSAFAGTFESLSIVVSDQNGALIASGRALLIDNKGNKICDFDFDSKKKIPAIDVEIGSYILEIQSPGFKPFRKNIEIKLGQTNLAVQLELEEIKVNVEIERTEQEKRLDEAIGGYFSIKELESLPESGEDIKEELKKRYGDDILIKIDGDFEGSQFPSRAEISSIKVIRNTFDAEFHDIGRTIIDIRTSAIANGFHGFGSFTLNSSNLNARNPFALTRLPTRKDSLIFLVSGPLIKNTTSFSVSSFRINSVTTQTFLGSGVNQGPVLPVRVRSILALTTLNIKHDISKNQLLNFKYQNVSQHFKNFGFGSFDLPGRGSSLINNQNTLRVTESGTFKNKYLNDLTLEFSTSRATVLPESSERTIVVLNSFNQGSSGINNQNTRRQLKLSDTISFDVDAHSLKVGTEIEYEKLNNISKDNLVGTFTFINLTDFNIQRPTQFSQTLAETEYNLNQLRSSLYFQDYFKLARSVQFSLGLRYEIQNYVHDHNNFSPRFGYVWSPETTGKFIIRGGIGVFYDWLDTQTLSAILSNDGRQGARIVIRNPGFPDPYNGGVVSQPLTSISKLQGRLSTPYIFVSQAGFNYKVDKSLTLEGIYTFRRGLHHYRSRNINAPLNGVRPDSNFGIVQLLESSGVSTEHSFEIRTNAYYKGINIYGNYQIAKQTSDFSDVLGLPSDNYDIRLDRGPSSLNQPHKFNLSLNLDIWKSIKVSPSFRLESGLPYTVTTGRDDNGDSVFNDRPIGIRRNSERGEWLRQTDLRFQWKLPMKYVGVKVRNDRHSINLNTNIRNLFNTANLTNYVGVQTSPFFKRATFARSARSIDVGMSFLF